MANPIDEMAKESEIRLRLTLAYDGTHYAGSQRQANGRTIQAELEDALRELHGCKVVVDFASRTDSGVHALGMVAAYRASTRLEPKVIRKALNAKLPKDVRVLHCESVHLDFHPRYDARSKLYRYRLWVAEQWHPLVQATTWHQRVGLRAEEMMEAGRLLEGEKDFGAFRSLGSGETSTVRNLKRVRLRRRGRLWSLDFEGDGFLRHQVRSMVGSLVEVGRGWRTVQQFAEMVESGRRELAGPTAPARGLILIRIRY